MQEFIDWIVGNWQFVSSAAISVVSFILLLIFRKCKLVDNSLIYHICGWVAEAERKFINGDDKKVYVLEKAKNYLGEDYSKSDVGALIEYVLSLPQKKG